MMKRILIGLLIAAAMLAMISVGAVVGGHQRGDVGDSRQAVPPMDCTGTDNCG